MAQIYHDDDPKKLRPLTVPKIVEQLERALMDIKYNQGSREESKFLQSENVPIKTDLQIPGQFIGKELMLFEMIGILNGKITELEIKCERLNGEFSTSGKLQNSKTALATKKIDEADVILNQKNQKINEVILKVVNEAKSSATKIPISVGLDHEIELFIDKTLLDQAIKIILNNAINSTDKGFIKVESFLAHEQNVFIIRISHNGKEIPKELLPKIFEKNEEADQNTSLYLCNEIIKSHGGNITAKNNKDAGTTYTISIPIRKNQ